MQEEHDTARSINATADIIEGFTTAYCEENLEGLVDSFYELVSEHIRLLSDICEFPELSIELEMINAAMESAWKNVGEEA